ncbi:MAG: hypothetical protein JW888_07815 [Pirellulales bacterium]|nr:hypothetical protein [Pirellulales bacterium]
MLQQLLAIGLAIVLLLILGPPRALAGGGPENVCLVVNPNSPESLVIANHYMQLRHIPPGNVVYVPQDPLESTVMIGPFREQILGPVLQTLDRRKLGGQIDYIIYSAGFPTAVNFTPDVKAFLKKTGKSDWPKQIGMTGSITGLTYLYPYVMGRNLDFVSPVANRYMRPVVGGRQSAPTMGFRGAYQFDESGRLVTSGGPRYLLSAMLGVIPTEKQRGLSIGETIAYLNRSLKADGTQPLGKVYFTLTKDKRTTGRASAFPVAQDALRELDMPSEVISTKMPMGKNNVLGLTCGAANFSWDKTGSTLLPGAICDNLTSTGGRMMGNHGQTPFIEFLKCGAAGGSGTVAEPYLIPAKFPSPLIHAHYVRGCSLAEAFYQSIHGPYQQLIIGDALCQPFAQIPRVSAPEIKPGQQVRGVLALRPKATIPPKAPRVDPNAKVSAVEESADVELSGATDAERVDHFELFVDGVRTQIAKPGEPISLDTAKLADGYHEIRIVAVGPAPIFTQGREIIWIVTANHKRTITATTPSNRVTLDGTLSVTAKSPGAKRIEIRHNGRTLGTIKGSSGSTTFKAAQLGMGFAYLQVIGIHGEKPEEQAIARPIVLWVK